MSDLASLLPAPLLVTALGRQFEIRELPAFDMAAYFEAIRPVAGLLIAGEHLAACGQNPDAVIRVLQIGAGLTPDESRALPADEMVDLLNAVIQVNSDFFVRRVLPRIVAGREQIMALMQPGTPTPSPTSPGADTPSTTPPA
jgi:hypothetical protein